MWQRCESSSSEQFWHDNDHPEHAGMHEQRPGRGEQRVGKWKTKWKGLPGKAPFPRTLHAVPMAPSGAPPVDTNLKNRLPEEHKNDHSDSHEATKDQPKPSWKHPSRQAPGMSAQTGSWEL